MKRVDSPQSETDDGYLPDTVLYRASAPCWVFLLLSSNPPVLKEPLTLAFFLPVGIITLLLIGSGLVSGSEVAFFSLEKRDLQHLKQQEGYTSRLVVKLLNHPKHLLSSILVANNLINIAIIITSSYVFLQWFNLSAYPILEFIGEVILITFLILLFGEITPKNYATENNVQLARVMAVPLYFAGKVFYPLNQFLVSSTQFIENRITKKQHDITREELDRAIDLTSRDEATTEEKKILKELINFGNTPVKQIMVNRVDVVAFSTDTIADDLLSQVREHGYSRIPVYKETFDEVQGVLYIKDLLEHLNGELETDWRDLIRPPFFVPETKRIGDLLKEFQQKKVHLAIVVDEYGGSSGIVTLEDILEEIVGDIKDEYDVEEPSYVKIEQKNYIFEGKTLLSDLTSFFGVESDYFDEKKGDADSLAGLILELAGKLPDRKEKLRYKDFTFVIESVSKKRINKVRVIIDENKEESPSEKSASPDNRKAK